MMDATHAINELALSVIAGAYILLFILQLVLWNRMEKMMQLIQRMDIEVTGRMPDVKRRISTLEEQHSEMERALHAMQVSNHRPKLRDS